MGQPRDTTIQNESGYDNGGEENLMQFDDIISLQLAVLINSYDQTQERNNPLHSVTLDSGIQIFFERLKYDTILCMADSSFDTIIIQKVINLLLALIKFHLGVLPFNKSNNEPIIGDLISVRISAAIQLFLNDINSNQAYLFESCEYLYMNSLVKQHCVESFILLAKEIQLWLETQPSIMIICCRDKIVYFQTSSDWCRPSSADLFLLLLNNSSRQIRSQFTELKDSAVIAHKYKWKDETLTKGTSSNIRASFSHDTTDSTLGTLIPNVPQRSKSVPIIHFENAYKLHGSETVFLKTTKSNCAPFMLLTIPLTNEISVLSLIEWKTSALSTNLYELTSLVDGCILQQIIPESKLLDQMAYLVRVIEGYDIVKKNLEASRTQSVLMSEKLNTLFTQILNNTVVSATYERITPHLTHISRTATKLFRDLFFDSNEYLITDDKNKEVLQMEPIFTDTLDNDDTGRSRIKNQPIFNFGAYSEITANIKYKLTKQLQDCFSFIEVKAQRNITMIKDKKENLFSLTNSCYNEFPGLAHFVFTDRKRGIICTPALMQTWTSEHVEVSSNSTKLAYQKIHDFELECLKQLQNGYTSYTVADDHFTYNYTLWMEENNVC
ncbi:unnamed protein product [Didymodactylos carnosus]|nr:unnamed protein product [Didymodactylos carnosus]CAF3577824.1 unnamed protein product [Didymodactylos carnosus]